MAHTAQIASRDVPRHFPTASLDDCDYHSVPSVSKALTSRGSFLSGQNLSFQTCEPFKWNLTKLVIQNSLLRLKVITLFSPQFVYRYASPGLRGRPCLPSKRRDGRLAPKNRSMLSCRPRGSWRTGLYCIPRLMVWVAMLSMKTEKTSWDLKDLETILKVLFINVQFYEITSFSFKSGGPTRICR